MYSHGDHKVGCKANLPAVRILLYSSRNYGQKSKLGLTEIYRENMEPTTTFTYLSNNIGR